jgi:hypothetical protein
MRARDSNLLARILKTEFSGFRARAENGLLTKMTQTPKSVYLFSTTPKSCPNTTLASWIERYKESKMV